jgi:diguanylate cyclase (GGDEF)-like protein
MTPLPKILVVDDTPANLFSMRQLLASSGAQVFEAAGGEAALQLCLDHRFALILLDVHMPGMDGFEVANLLAATEQIRDTPIIFVTAAYADNLSQLKGYRAGAVDYIAKPINDVILQSKVRVFLELYTARCELQEAMDALSERNRQLTKEVAERARAEALVRHQASHDMLTGLPNRVLFHDRLHTAISRADRHHGQFALALLDIDGFKRVNDVHGHQAGDALLCEVARRMSARLRDSDTVARLGGDEFALILEDVDDPAVTVRVCESLGARLAEPYTLTVNEARIEVSVSASIGVVHFRPHGRPGADERLVQAADRAMYRAKQTGKNRCVLGDDQD